MPLPQTNPQVSEIDFRSTILPRGDSAGDKRTKLEFVVLLQFLGFRLEVLGLCVVGDVTSR